MGGARDWISRRAHSLFCCAATAVRAAAAVLAVLARVPPRILHWRDCTASRYHVCWLYVGPWAFDKACRGVVPTSRHADMRTCRRRRTQLGEETSVRTPKVYQELCNVPLNLFCIVHVSDDLDPGNLEPLEAHELARVTMAEGGRCLKVTT